MRIEFVTNATALFSLEGFTIVTDPWLVDGAFHGSWCHYPAVRMTPEELAGRVDAIYISHAHPDHYDEATLRHFPHDMPIFTVDQPPNILHRLLVGMGFTDIRLIPPRERVAVGPFTGTFFRAHDAHPRQKALVENILDSSVLLEAGEVSVMNFNDNIPSLETCRTLRRDYGRWTAIMLQYSAASPFPSCFGNLDDGEKQVAHERVRQTYVNDFIAISEILEPDVAIPFAGDFVIGGRRWALNRRLGTVIVDEMYQALDAKGIRTVRLSEGRIVDMTDLSCSGEEYRPHDSQESAEYIRLVLSQLPYSYDRYPKPEPGEFDGAAERLLPLARAHLAAVQKRLGASSDTRISVRLGDRIFWFDMSGDLPGIFAGREAEAAIDGPLLAFETDPRALIRMLDGRYHFNNLMVGMHIDFYRRPEAYDPDVYTLLSYFHVPRDHDLARPAESSAAAS